MSTGHEFILSNIREERAHVRNGGPAIISLSSMLFSFNYYSSSDYHVYEISYVGSLKILGFVQYASSINVHPLPANDA